MLMYKEDEGVVSIRSTWQTEVTRYAFNCKAPITLQASREQDLRSDSNYFNEPTDDIHNYTSTLNY